MSSQSRENARDPRWRSWNWVSNKTFAATPFYRRAWQILKQDWLVFVWKLVVDFVARSSTVVVGLLVISLFALDLQWYTAAGGTPFGWLDRVVLILRSPMFLTGLVGALFFTALLTTAGQALVVGGIWGLVDVGLGEREIRRWSTFWRQALGRFPDVFALYLVRFAVGVVNILLAIALGLAFYHATTVGTLPRAPQWLWVLLIAGSSTVVLAWIGLTRLALEVTGAPLVIDGVDLGEALLRGGAFALDNFWSLYRLIIFAAGVLLVPLGIYWAAIMVNNLTALVPALAAVGSVIQLGGQAFLTLSVTVVWIFFHGALFAFYHRDDRAVAREGDDAPYPSVDDADPQPPPAGIFRRGVTLDEFIPDAAPYRFSIDAVLSSNPPSGAESNGPSSGGEDDE